MTTTTHLLPATRPMSATLRTNLRRAGKAYGACAAQVEKKIAPTKPLSQALSEQAVGLGIASHWVRRAADMTTIEYVGSPAIGAAAKTGFLEIVRFGFAWSAIDAIFTRPALATALGLGATSSELQSFTSLYNLGSGTARATSRTRSLATLHSILNIQTTTRIPGYTGKQTVATITAIHAKYMPKVAKGVVGKSVANAALAGNASSLTLPALIYAFRNWSVHGNSLGGAFDSLPGFMLYTETLLECLADVHIDTAAQLKTKL